MTRLKRVLSLVRPTGQDGLRVDRKLSYELHAPDTSQAHYTARVTIDSETAYRHESSNRDSQAGGSGNHAKGDSSLGNAGRGNPLSDSFTGNPRKPKGNAKALNAQDGRVKTARLSVQKVYDLIYRDGRWQLQTKPDTEHERMWFEYALQQ